MEKPLILMESEFQKELTSLLNRYIPHVPARYLRFNIEDVQRLLLQIEEQQLANANKMYAEESEVKEDG